MPYTSFPGQLPKERLLYVAEPHPISEAAGYVAVGFIYIVWLLLTVTVPSFIPSYSTIIQILMVIIGLAAGGYGLWWVIQYKKGTAAFVSDERVVSFRILRPKKTAELTLHWKDAEKAVCTYPNIVWKSLGIGTVSVYGFGKPGVVVPIAHVTEADILARYINSVIIKVHSYPEAVSSILPYDLIPKNLRSAL